MSIPIVTQGTAQAGKSGSTVACSVNGVVTVVQVARDLTVGAGDVLLLAKTGQAWVAVARMFTAAPADPEPTPPPTPNPVVVAGKLVIPAVYTGSYRSGSWRTDTTDLVQGTYGGSANSTGAAFYGSKPKTLTGATVTSASIVVRRGDGGAYAPQQATLWLVTQATKPGGAPTLTSSTTGPNISTNSTQTAFAVPTSWAQALVDGTAGGLAVFDSSGSPYVRFTGRGDYSTSFQLTINYRR